jgi:hypothetical protein
VKTFERLACLACLIALSTTTGCGAILHGTRQNVQVQSSTPGTMVTTAPGANPVAAPSMLSLERKNSYVLTFSAPGYTSSTVALQNSIGVGTVIADVLLTGLVGVVVDGTTGAWYGLNPESASVTLQKQVGVIGPDEIKVEIIRTDKRGHVKLSADAPGVSVAVRAK